MTLEILTGLLVVVTGYYAWVAHSSLKVMREQNDRLTRPYVVIRPVRDSQNILLEVENTGRTSAEDLKLDIDKSFHCAGEEDSDLREQHLFSEGVGSFAPGSKVVHLLGTTGQLYPDESANMPWEFEIEARYVYADNQVTEKTTVDLNQFAKLFVPTTGVRAEIRKIRQRELKKVRRDLKKVRKALGEVVSK